MQFNCPSCGRSLAAPDGVFGQEGACKFCGATIVSPHAEGASATLKSTGGPSFVPEQPPVPTGETPPPGAQYPSAGGYPPRYASRSQGSGLAVASLVLGALGIVTCWLTSIPGLICGILAIGQTGRGSGRESGRNMAIAGTAVSGGCTVLAIPILAAILFPVFAKAREQARQTTCLDNMKQLGLAMRLYSADYEGHLPPAASWNASIGSYVKAGGTGLFTCPSSEDPRAPYKMNRAVGGVSIFALQSPANTISLFDATPGGSVYGGSPDVAARHYSHGQDAATFGFADGHVHVAPPAELRGAPWNPLLIAPKRPGKP